MDSEIVSIDMPDITQCDTSFTSLVHNLPRSPGADSITSPIHGFALTVDNAMRTIGADWDTSSVHSFGLIVDNAMRTLGADSDASPAHDFASTVDNLTRTLGADSGTFPVHGFASAVDNAIRSLGADSGTYPVHDFASTVDNAMRSLGADSGTSPALDSGVYGFQSFTLAELIVATKNFSLNNKIGAGSFGCVYRGGFGGCEVVIKRGQISSNKKEFQEILHHLYLSIFVSQLHHKNLLGIIGFCNEKDERILVYEYMKNGSLYDRLHDKDNVEKGSSVLNSWRMRIKIALDASRGIEYVHNYADPCNNIHKDIKSSNILLDATWTARVADFGLLTKAAGTVGYIDPEYYVLNQLTEKSDAYGLGVVLFELLTGKRPIFKSGEDGATPFELVEFAFSAILGGEFVKVLDPRVGPPDVDEVKAVEIMAYTAIDCVNLKGKDRPAMVNIVVNLERALAICDNSHDKALAICDNSHGSISSSTIPVILHTKKKKKHFFCFRI